MKEISILTTLEYKRMFKKKGIYIGVLIATLYALAIAINALSYPAEYSSVYIHSFFSNIAALVILIYSANILSEDFKYKTANIIFTNGYSRYQVVLAKLMCTRLRD